TAMIAILSGAQFIVSPILDKRIAILCNKYSIPYIPGCMTLTECVEAMEYGVDIVKLFPSSVLGPLVIKAFKGPMPDIQLMPTGGVNITNIKDWLEAGSTMVGIGGEITKKKSNYSEITNNSRLFLNKIKEWENEQ